MIERRLRILHLEDNLQDAELIRRELTRGGIEADVTQVSSGEAFRAQLSSRAFDIILADFHLPSFDGMTALQIANEIATETPFIFVSGAIGEERAIAAMQLGATDYIIKDRTSRLTSAVRRALAERGAQRELRVSQERFLLAAQATLDVIWDWSVKDHTFWVNDALRLEWGHDLPPAGATPEWWKTQIHPADAGRVYDGLMSAVASGALRWRAEYRFRRRGNTYGWVHDRAIIVRDDSGRTVRVIGAMQDITARVEAERKLEREQRISSLGRVAAVIAHEFNNVLMGIQPFAEVIRLRAGANEDVAKALRYINSAIARGRGITGDILRAANPGEPALETLDLAAWLREIAAEIRGILRPEIALLSDIPLTPVMARCDPRQLHQVIMNLAINARDAIKDAGELRITMAIEYDEIAITVADTGSGIPEDILPRVFDPLFTTKHTGTGLGLAVAKQIVARNGGRIDVDSIEGKGTVFSIALPVAADEVQQDIEPERKSNATLSSIRRLLIVDDDQAIAAGMTTLLELAGFVVHCVERAAEVKQAVSEFHPDAVILDLTLPDGHGTDVYRSLAATDPDLPVVFASGNDEPPAIRAWSAESRVSFLRKPYDVSTLMDRLHELAS